MRYWNDFTDKYGFNEGCAVPAEAMKLRPVYVEVLNTLATRMGSSCHAEIYNRPGCHNDVMILVLDKDGKSCQGDDMFDAAVAFAEEYLDIDGLIDISVNETRLADVIEEARTMELCKAQ